MSQGLLEFYKQNTGNGIMDIEEDWFGRPVVIDKTLEEGCRVSNDMMGTGVFIVDEDAIKELLSDFDEENINPSDPRVVLTSIQRKIQEYFYSDTPSNMTRQEVYCGREGRVCNEEGMTIGHKLSTFKGKNVAECSEKTVAAYMILETLYRKGAITTKPSILLTKLGTDEIESGKHACILLDEENEKYPQKHMLYDPENISAVVNDEGQEIFVIGLYALRDNEYNDLTKKGIKCAPKPIIELISPFKVKGGKLIYGSVDRDKEVGF